MRLDHHPEAVDEAASAYRWYESHSPGSAIRFREELTELFDQVAAHPRRERTIAPGVRRALLRSFPYMVVYAVGDDSIRIVAVSHTSRRPGYWRSRL